MAEISRARYAALYGPTAGDRIRLADTDLLIEVTEDRCGGPGPLAGRRGHLRRRQGHPRVDGPGHRHPGRGHPGPGHHRGGGARPLGRDQGRRRACATAGSWPWARPATPTPWTASRPAGHRAVDRDPRRQRDDPDRGRRRQPRAPDRPAADPGRAGRRDDHADRRRHRPGRGDQGDHGDAGRLLAGRRCWPPHAHWPVNVALLGKGNTVSAEGLWEQLRAGAAGFKLHEDWGTTPGRHRRLPDRGPGRRGPGGDPHRHPQRGRLPGVDAGRDRRPADPHLPHRGRGRRARTGHHQGRRARRTCCPPRPTRPGPTPATRSTSTSTC